MTITDKHIKSTLSDRVIVFLDALNLRFRRQVWTMALLQIRVKESWCRTSNGCSHAPGQAIVHGQLSPHFEIMNYDKADPNLRFFQFYQGGCSAENFVQLVTLHICKETGILPMISPC